MKVSYSLHNLFIALVATIAFCLPLIPKVLPILIIVLVVIWFIISFKESSFRRFVKSRKLLLLLPLYFIYLISLVYSEDVNRGLKDLESKLSLLIFPFIFFNVKISDQNCRQILLVFLAGCLFSMAFNLVQSAYSFYIHYTLNIEYNFYYFLYSNASPIIHTSYLSLYYCLAICIILNFLRSGLTKSVRIILYLTLISLIIFIFMLSSKAGILSLLIIFGYYLFLFLRGYVSFRRSIVPAVVVLIFVVLFLAFIPGATSRLMINPELFTSDVSIEPDTDDSSELRVLVWKSAMEIIKDNRIFGVGAGDVKSELLKEYESLGIVWAIHHNLNAHNQFLQTWIATGIFGVVALCIWLFLLLKNGITQRDHVQILFAIILTINFLFESMLETQAGIIFMAFFTCFFIFNKDAKISKSMKSSE